MIVAGLNANGFDRNTWIASGKQGIFEEDNFTSPGYVASSGLQGVPGLRIALRFITALMPVPILTKRILIRLPVRFR